MSEEKSKKPKSTKSKVSKVIAVVQSLPVDEQQKAEAIEELNDLLDPVVEKKEGSLFIGYHPITGEEVWQ